jgi:hypothetical protein
MCPDTVAVHNCLARVRQEPRYELVPWQCTAATLRPSSSVLRN